jgi:hypothetical protein
MAGLLQELHVVLLEEKAACTTTCHLRCPPFRAAHFICLKLLPIEILLTPHFSQHTANSIDSRNNMDSESDQADSVSMEDGRSDDTSNDEKPKEDEVEGEDNVQDNVSVQDNNDDNELHELSGYFV